MALPTRCFAFRVVRESGRRSSLKGRKTLSAMLSGLGSPRSGTCLVRQTNRPEHTANSADVNTDSPARSRWSSDRTWPSGDELADFGWGTPLASPKVGPILFPTPPGRMPHFVTELSLSRRAGQAFADLCLMAEARRALASYRLRSCSTKHLEEGTDTTVYKSSPRCFSSEALKPPYRFSLT